MTIVHKELDAKLEKLMEIDMMPGVRKAILRVQDEAKTLCPGNHGELRRSIYTDTEDVDGACRGTCYTNKEYAMYVEFGTGPNGQESHAGISPNVNVVYNQTGWTIPANAMPVEEAERYGLGIARGKDGELIGYYTNGQAAHPFMYPALKNNEEEVVQIITDYVRSQL